MKKVTFVITHFSSGGAERVLSIIADSFAKETEYDVTVVMLEEYRVDYDINPAIHVVAIKKPQNKIKRLFYRIVKLREIFQNTDVIISFLWHINLYTIVSSALLSKRVIISDRSDPNNELIGNSSFIKQLRRYMYGLADCIVFQMPDAKNYYPAKVQKKSCIIPNPINPLLLVPNLGTRDKSILIAGRLAPQKNIQLAIKAFFKFSKIHNDYVLKIFGQGPQKNELESLIRKLGITSKVRLEGFSDRIYEEMNKAGMYLSTSNYEGISNSMLEALGLGMPVIVTDCPVGGARQYVRNGENGILIPVNDENALLHAMNYIADNSEFVHKLSLNAVQIREQLAADKISKMWEDLL